MNRWIPIVGAANAIAAPALAPARAQKATPAESEGQWAAQMVELTNAARKKEGLAPLKAQEQLTRAAQAHAEDMAKRGYFSHTDPDGKQPWDRVTARGYAYRSCGENIAWGQRTPQQVVQTWLKSPGHRHNIMGDFTDIGVGFARSTAKGHRMYWVQMFGAPAR